jgi:hypothetical protein
LFGSQTQSNYSILKIMKKILTILTAASLFAVVSASAQRAQAADGGDVTLTGEVKEYCKIKTKKEAGTLVRLNRHKLITQNPGVVEVDCNAATSTLSVKVNTVDAPAGAPDPKPFLSSGTGKYGSIPLEAESYTATGVVDDAKAGINASFDAGSASLPAGKYKVKLTPSVVPF